MPIAMKVFAAAPFGFLPPESSYSSPSFNVGTVVIVFGVLILFFFLIREILCWYWKINEGIDILKQIEINTRPQQQAELLSEISEQGSGPGESATPNTAG